jgi:selenocysteine lyase/cysteine desulfurase
VGWISVPDNEAYGNFDQDWRPGALAWETGTGASALIYGVESSLRLLSETGVERIAAHLESLTDYLCEKINRERYEVISSRLKGEKSQIVSIRHLGGRQPMELFSHLKQRNIITAPRGEGLRIAPHLYNTQAEIDFLLSNLP